MTTLEDAVKEDVNKSLNDWAKYIYLLGYEEAKNEIVHCKDCKHRPRRSNVDDEHEGFNLEFPDWRCPCRCDDEYYNWMPDDNWHCGNAERKEE